MIGGTNRAFVMSFHWDPIVLGFTAAVTLGVGLLFGALPAWRVTRSDTGASLKEESRSATGSAGRMRRGRALVGLQLGLSLPLLVGAGLLVRTVYNLQRMDLGFPADHLLLLRVDMREAGYNAVRRSSALEEIVRVFQQMPGVRSVTFSSLGIMSGGFTSWKVDVEGYVPKGAKDRGSQFEAVGPAYFSTLGASIVAGRDIQKGDKPGRLEASVINEAFAKQFFEGRDPLGRRITVHDNNQKPITFVIVGVAKNAHTGNPRREVEPRFYAPPAELDEMSAPFFLIRTDTSSIPILAAARQPSRHSFPEESSRRRAWAARPPQSESRSPSAALRRHKQARHKGGSPRAPMPRSQRQPRSEPRSGPARSPGRSVLQWFARTQPATPGRTAGPLTGLIIGAALAYGAARLISSQLFGVAPGDPAISGLAAALLVGVAFAATLIPARRASRLNPIDALRGE
jgi:hypothetical protein